MILQPFLCLVLAMAAIGCNSNTKQTTNTANMNTDSTLASKKTTDSASAGYAPVNGLKMYYEIYGNGIPLVLIHGGGSTIQTSFGNILPMLAAHYKVIAVELQAHGHTRDRGIPSSFEQDADDVAALLQYLTIPKANIFGFSNGGSAALQIAIRHPDKVIKLVTLSAATKRNALPPGFFDGMKNASLHNMPAPLQAAYLAINNNKDDLQVMHDRDKIRMIEFKDWPDAQLESIKAPTLLMSSDKDVILPEHTLYLSKKIPHANLVILPGVHGAAIGEVCTAIPGSKLPAITVALISDFLENTTTIVAQ